jgi:hypothetical protein
MLIFIYANCSGFSREFRVVRDNRVNHIYKEVKPPSQQQPTSTTSKLPVNTSEKGYVLIFKFTGFGWGLVDFPFYI